MSERDGVHSVGLKMVEVGGNPLLTVSVFCEVAERKDGRGDTRVVRRGKEV